jgi:uracil-DNA glycosylase
MKRVAFIGQAMPRSKNHPHDWPTLNKWLYSIGISDDQISDNFFYSALVDYFPGSKGSSHRVPTEREIVKEKPRLKKDLGKFKPEIVVTIGKLSLSHCLGIKVEKLDVFIGKTFVVDPYGVSGRKVLVIPLPHPSGASTWHRRENNIKLLKKALQVLKRNLF